MHEIRAPNDAKNYKPEYFFFVSAAKGSGTPQNRSYDFKSQFTTKYSIDEVISLSFMLKQFAQGNAFALKGGYVKFAANGKNVSGSVGETPKGGIVFNLWFNDGNNKSSEPFTPAVAFSFATRMEKLYNLAIDRETQRAIDNPNINQNARKAQMDQAPNANDYPQQGNQYQQPNNQYPQQYQQPQQNTPFQQPPVNNQYPQQPSNVQQASDPFSDMNASFGNMMSNM